jgi:hypothetical protein
VGHLSLLRRLEAAGWFRFQRSALGRGESFPRDFPHRGGQLADLWAPEPGNARS